MEDTRTLSPSSSPRLPSPPPIPEVQIGLKSPTMNALPSSTLPGPPTLGKASPELADLSNPDNGVTRRIRPGTKAADMASGPPLVPLSEVDSSFQLQEHVKALYYHHTKSDKTNTTMALNHETALLIATPPEGVDRPLWLYEICRLLVIEVNALVIAFFSETPPCSAATCPEMRASEWQYLCAVHDPPKSCCAIDYCCHTLDWASNVLTSQKNFPSRLTLGSENTGGSQQGMRHLTNIFRRVYRIFAHAWFQHRASFWEVEGKKGLYIFFKTVCDAYTLIPDENYTISPEAEGITTEKEKEKEKEGKTILKRGEDAEIRSDDSDQKPVPAIPAGATTRRHKHTPSTGSLVTTIAEGDEDDSNAPPSPSEIDAPVAKIEVPAPSVPSNPPLPRPTSTAIQETAEEPANRNEDSDTSHRTEPDLPKIKDPDLPKIIETPMEEPLQRQESEPKEQNPEAENPKAEIPKTESTNPETAKAENTKAENPKEEIPKEAESKEEKDPDENSSQGEEKAAEPNPPKVLPTEEPQPQSQ